MNRIVVVFSLFLSVVAAQDRVQQPGDLASLVPAETLVLLELDDLGGYQRWVKDTALGRTWAEPEVQYFAKNLMTSIGKSIDMWGGTLGMVGLDPKDFDGIEIRRAGIALCGYSMQGRRPDIDMVLTIQLRSGGANVKKILGAVRGGLENFLGLQFQKIAIRGREVFHIAPQGFELYWTVQGDRFVFATRKARLESVLAALDEGHKSPLKSSPRYATIMRRMGADRSALTFYADVKALHAKTMGILNGRVPQKKLDHFQLVWKTLGLDGIEALAVADIPAGTGFRTELAITHQPGPPRGIFRLAPRGKVNHRFAKHAPSNALFYGAEHWSATEGLAAILDIYRALEPRAPERIEKGLAWFRQAFGVDLEKDLVAALGDDWAGYVGRPPQGGVIPDFCLFVSVKDKPRLEKALLTMMQRVKGMAAEKRVPIEIKETIFRGLRIRFVESPKMPLAPAWAFGDDYLVIALNPHAIRNAHVKKASLAGDEDFRALLRRIPESAASSSYVNTGAIVAWGYNTLVPILQSAQGAINKEVKAYGFQLNFHDLPPVEVITKHLGGSMGYTAPEDGVLRMGFVSPFGSPVIAVGVGFLAGTTAALVQKGQQEARRASRNMMRRERDRARVAEMRKQLAAQRARYEQRIARIEKQLAELRELIESGR